MEQVFRKLAAELESVSYLILDLKRVVDIDDCALSLLAQMKGTLAKKGRRLILSHLPPTTGRGLMEQREAGWSEDSFFPDTDAALEWCEKRLIGEEQADDKLEKGIMPLESMDILAGFDAREVALLQATVDIASFPAGEFIVREGDPADSLYLLAAGQVSVCLRLGNGTHQKRLATIAPGVAFGELAIFDGGTRSADVIADRPAICYMLQFAKLDELAACHPEIRTKLLCNIGRELSVRLRRADDEIRSLEE
jgi:glutaminase